MNVLAWTALFSPAVAVVAIALLGERIDRRSAGLLARGDVPLRLHPRDLLRAARAEPESAPGVDGLDVADCGRPQSAPDLIDPLSVFMMLVVSGVGFLILAYAIGYMHGDEEERRYHAYKALFVFSMLLLVMAGTCFVLAGGAWSGSSLLINYWHQRRAAVGGRRRSS
jgi:NADH-quinone oxidoreductase subunit L